MEVKHALRDGLLRPLLASPYHHLISSLYDPVPCVCRNCRGFIPEFPCFQWTRSRCALMRRLSGLTSVTLCMDVTRMQGAGPIPFPPRLRQVDLTLGCINSQVAGFVFDCSALLRGLSSCASLTRLELQFLDPNPINLSAMPELTQLRHFSLAYLSNAVLTPALMQSIKQLLLESLSFSNFNDDESAWEEQWDLSWIGPLLSAPHQLSRLTHLDVGPFFHLDEGLATALTSLPSLRCLSPEIVSTRALPLLSSLTKLRSLTLQFEGVGAEPPDVVYDEHQLVRASFIVTHLQPLSSLTKLIISTAAFTQSDFAALCSGHAQLQSLRLDDVAVASLAGLGTLVALREFALTLADHAAVPDGAHQIMRSSGEAGAQGPQVSAERSGSACAQAALRAPASTQEVRLLQSLSRSFSRSSASLSPSFARRLQSSLHVHLPIFFASPRVTAHHDSLVVSRRSCRPLAVINAPFVASPPSPSNLQLSSAHPLSRPCRMPRIHPDRVILGFHLPLASRHAQLYSCLRDPAADRERIKCDQKSPKFESCN